MFIDTKRRKVSVTSLVVRGVEVSKEYEGEDAYRRVDDFELSTPAATADVTATVVPPASAAAAASDEARRSNS